MVAPEVVVKNIVPTLELGQSRVVLGEWLKDIHGQPDDLCGCVYGHTTGHG